MDEFNRRRKIIENKLIYVKDFFADDDKSQKPLRRMTRAALKKELPKVESTGTDVDAVIDMYYNLENN